MMGDATHAATRFLTHRTPQLSSAGPCATDNCSVQHIIYARRCPGSISVDQLFFFSFFLSLFLSNKSRYGDKNDVTRIRTMALS